MDSNKRQSRPIKCSASPPVQFFQYSLFFVTVVDLTTATVFLLFYPWILHLVVTEHLIKHGRGEGHIFGVEQFDPQLVGKAVGVCSKYPVALRITDKTEKGVVEYVDLEKILLTPEVALCPCYRTDQGDVVGSPDAVEVCEVKAGSPINYQPNGDLSSELPVERFASAILNAEKQAAETAVDWRGWVPVRIFGVLDHLVPSPNHLIPVLAGFFSS